MEWHFWISKHFRPLFANRTCYELFLQLNSALLAPFTFFSPSSTMENECVAEMPSFCSYCQIHRKILGKCLISHECLEHSIPFHAFVFAFNRTTHHWFNHKSKNAFVLIGRLHWICVWVSYNRKTSCLQKKNGGKWKKSNRQKRAPTRRKVEWPKTRNAFLVIEAMCWVWCKFKRFN